MFYNPTPSYRKPVKRKPVSMKTALREAKKAIRDLAKYDKETAEVMTATVKYIESLEK